MAIRHCVKCFAALLHVALKLVRPVSVYIITQEHDIFARGFGDKDCRNLHWLTFVLFRIITGCLEDVLLSVEDAHLGALFTPKVERWALCFLNLASSTSSLILLFLRYQVFIRMRIDC